MKSDSEPIVVGRRFLISGLLAATLVPAAASEPDIFNQAQQNADALAASMAAIHGGKWKVCLNHDAGFVLIKPVTI